MVLRMIGIENETTNFHLILSSIYIIYMAGILPMACVVAVCLALTINMIGPE